MRIIRFEPPEIVQAVREYQRRIGQPLPAGTVTSCARVGYGDDDIVRYAMVVTGFRMPQIGRAPAREPDRYDVVIDEATLQAALILFCHDSRIPLPRRSTKSLRYLDPDVSLVLTIGRPVHPADAMMPVG